MKEDVLQNNQPERNFDKNNSFNESLKERDNQGSFISDYYDNYTYSYSSSYSEEEKDKSKYIYIHNFKDFLIMFSLLICSSFNFSYLYLPLLLIGFYYIKYIMRNTMLHRRKKSSFETIIFIYSILLLIFKIVIIILALKKNDFVNNQRIFIDLGIYYLFSEGIFSIIKTVIGESIIIISCIFSFTIRKNFSFEDADLNKKKENEEKNLNKFFSKVVKYIFLSFFILLGFATFNKSILTFCFVLTYYVILILYSLISKRRVYLITIGAFASIIIFIILHILVLNISNINSIAHNYFDPEIKDKTFIIDNWKKIGFYYSYYKGEDEYKDLFIDWTGYLLECLSLVVLSFIYKDISLNNFNEAKNNKSQNNENNIKFVKEPNCLVKIFKSFIKFCSGPFFILHIVRILSIIWLYFYRNFYSIGVFIWLFLSFLYLNVVNIGFITIIILLPSIFISLVSLNGSRFLTYFSDLNENELELKIKYMNFALGNYSYDYIKFYVTNIFFSFIIIFISVLNKNDAIDDKKDDNNLKQENELKRPLLNDIENDTTENIKELNESKKDGSILNIDQIKEEKIIENENI